MFESTLLSTLQADGELAQRLSSYNGAPAIFSDRAPEDAALPYIVFNITRLQDTGNRDTETFNVYVDYWDEDKSAAESRAAAQRIEFALDQKVLTHERYTSIRVFFESGGHVPSTDPRDIHYNTQFSARGFRKAWADQL